MRTGYRIGIGGTKPIIGRFGRTTRESARRWTFVLPGIGVLGGFASAAMGAEVNPWIEVAGRTHPILVHFPIALLAAACVFELVRIVSGRDKVSPAAVGCLVLAVVGAAGAGVTGWLLADHAGRAGEQEVELHRWVAIGGAAVALVAVVLAGIAKAWGARTLRRLYVLCLFVGATAVGVAGHFGGGLVYGADYVFAPLLPKKQVEPPVVVVATDPNAVPVSFARDVLPILQAECADCHGERKQGAKLRLDSMSALRASPHVDEVVIPFDAKQSLLYDLITLPPDDHDFMPRKGEPLSAWQIETIRRWIDDGASFEDDSPVEQVAEEPEPVEQSDDEETSDVQGTEPSDDVSRALGEVIASVRARGGYASLVAADVPELVVNYSIVTPPLTEQDVALLMPVADRVVELNAGGVGVSDAVMTQIGRLSGLQRLNVSRSQISDAAMAALTGLTQLEVINVYGCTIGSESVETIAGMPTLKRVYVWQTGMDGAAIERLRELRPGLEVIAGGEEKPAPEAVEADEAATAGSQ